jgi:hypothetical protein
MVSIGKTRGTIHEITRNKLNLTSTFVLASCEFVDRISFSADGIAHGNYGYDDRPGQRWKDRASLEQLRFSETPSATWRHLALGKSSLLFRT